MISKFSVKKPYTVLVGVVLAIILGIVSYTKMTADLLPNISLPYVVVVTTYPGASPETVETVVTAPVESAMATVSNIESITSTSNESYSMVVLEFAQTADMNAVSLEIRENLDQIKSYWDDSVGNPIIMKLNPDMLPVMVAAVGMEGMDTAAVSDYVQEFIMPELESLEGVASVSATGLLEESVSVVISQDKVDKVNELIYAAIDKKMADAAQQLEDGKQQLEDGEKELEDGRKELENAGKEVADGRKELENGKAELANGKTELEKKQEEISAQLAAQKTALQTAKNNLQTIQINLTTAQALNAGIKQIEEAQAGLAGLTGCSLTYSSLSTKLTDAKTALQLDPDDAQAQADYDAAVADIAELKANVTGNAVLKAALEEAGNADVLEHLTALDWTDETNISDVSSSLSTVEVALVTTNVAMEVKKLSVETQLFTVTGGLGYDDYYAQISATLAAQNITDINAALNSINEGLIQIEKGQMTAAIEFADGKNQLALGEYKLQLAETQLNSGAEQVTSGLEQLEEARKQLEEGRQQLEEGEKELADAKEKAYESADMNAILTVDTVKALLSAQNFAMPAGYVYEEGKDFLIRVGDKPATLEDLKELPLIDLHMEDVPVITLKDVADVTYTDNADEIYTNVDGSAGVMLSIQKQTGYSTGAVSDLLADRFEELMEENPRLTIITLMDQGIYIDMVMDSIFNNIVFGFGLAILILLLFLKDIRPTAVVAVSVPISLVTAVVCMYFSGVTLNIISLSGLALGIGMLVDNSIVVIENIYRLKSLGMDTKEAAVQGAKEVAGAILASTLTTVCVFLPIVFTEGITRQLFVDMGLTIAFSLLASLAVALTVVPAMASAVLTGTKEQKESRIFTAMTKGYEKILEGALRIKGVVLIGALLLVFVSLGLAYTNGTAFMSDMDSTQMTVTVELPKTATLEDTRELSNIVCDRLLAMEEVQNVGAMTSSSTLSLLAGGGGSTNSATIYVVTREDKKHTNEEIARDILDITSDLDAEISVDTSAIDMSALGGSGITIQVRGRDVDELRRIAGEVTEIVESVEGTTEVSNGLSGADEEMRILIDRDEAVKYGLTVAQVFQQIYVKVADAASATTLVSADKDYNVYVKRSTDIALTRELLKELLIEGTDENQAKVKVKLSDIASFETTATMDAINRADQTRYIAVSASIADGYNVGLVSTAVEKKLDSYVLPSGYRFVFSGENEMITDAMEQLVLMMILAIAFMYLIMVAQFQSLKSPFIILFTIPLAFTGGFLGLYFSGSEISVIAMIGFIMLAGVIVNNGIVLIDYINQLREEGMFKKEAILTAGRTRLRPVLMTALTTILALSTMVFGNDMGSEMGRPMAIVTIGGLIYGTLMTLIVIPCVYDLFHREKREDIVRIVNLETDPEDKSEDDSEE